MEDKSIVDLALLFKERDNPNLWQITTVKLINKNPISFKLAEKIFVNDEYKNMTLTDTAYNKIQASNLNDEFLAIPLTSGSMWYIIDKVVR